VARATGIRNAAVAPARRVVPDAHAVLTTCQNVHGL
jgi:hypothetical protein